MGVIGRGMWIGLIVFLCLLLEGGVDCFVVSGGGVWCCCSWIFVGFFFCVAVILVVS